jgi:hypothetical protein
LVRLSSRSRNSLRQECESELVFRLAPGPHDCSEAAHRRGRVWPVERQERHDPRRAAI